MKQFAKTPRPELGMEDFLTRSAGRLNLLVLVQRNVLAFTRKGGWSESDDAAIRRHETNVKDLCMSFVSPTRRESMIIEN